MRPAATFVEEEEEEKTTAGSSQMFGDEFWFLRCLVMSSSS
jgi:hypothetical protein